MRVASIVWFCLFLMLCATPLELRADPPVENPAPSPLTLDQQVQQIDQRAQEIRQQLASAQQNELEVRRELTRLQLENLEIQQQIKSVQQKLEKLQQDLAAQRKEVDKNAVELAAAETALTEAQKNKETPAETLSTLQKAVDAAREKHQEATQKVDVLMSASPPLKTMLEQLPPQTEEKERAIAEQKTKLQQAQHTTTEFQTALNTERKQVETLLQQAGEWVSFADEIAPIFHSRCLACHNSRSAKGQYNMETYAGIMSVGESGEVILPGDAESSLLCIMVEDGSMPKESDPLTPQQIEKIERWVKRGARLDSKAAPDQPLIQIMPRVVQPTPPEVYSAPVAVSALAISPEGTRLASSGYHEVLLWSLPEGQLQRRITNVAQNIYDLVFLPQGNRIAVATGTPAQLGEVKIFDVQTGELTADLAIAADSMLCLAVSPDGTQLAAGGADRSIRVFDLAQGKEIQTIEAHADWVNDIAWSLDGKLLVSASRDKTAKVLEVSTGKVLTTFANHQNPVTQVLTTENSQQVISAGDDRRIRVWQVETGKEVRSIKDLPAEITRLVPAAGNRFFVLGADQKIRDYSSADGKLIKSYAGKQDWGFSLATHLPAQLLASGYLSGEIQLWNLKEGQLLKSWTASPGLVEK